MHLEIIEFLKKQNAKDIIDACNDIYEYRYVTGVLKKDSIIHHFAKELNYKQYDIVEAIEIYSAEFFEKIVKLLMIEKPYLFIERR